MSLEGKSKVLILTVFLTFQKYTKCFNFRQTVQKAKLGINLAFVDCLGLGICVFFANYLTFW